MIIETPDFRDSSSTIYIRSNSATRVGNLRLSTRASSNSYRNEGYILLKTGHYHSSSSGRYGFLRPQVSGKIGIFTGFGRETGHLDFQTGDVATTFAPLLSSLATVHRRQEICCCLPENHLIQDLY